MAAPRDPGRGYLELLPERTVAMLARLEFRARGRRRGTVSGRHTGARKGFSVEFAEHREYAPGDDLRGLDWRVFAKADRPYIKQYVEESNLRATLVLDASGSMAYRGESAVECGGRPASKFEAGRLLAAALAHLFVAQQDAVGLVTFDTGVRAACPAAARRSQTHRILSELERSAPAGETALAPVLHEVAERVPRRGLVVLISDLFDRPGPVLEALHHLRARSHELVVFHTLADEERTFPFERFGRFRDLEDRRSVVAVEPGKVRAEYLRRFGEFLDSIRHGCGKLRADYVPLPTSRGVADVLSAYLASRR